MVDRLGPYDLNTIITGNARELTKDIPDESVDLVFTDPVYDRIADYRWLAKTAARILKPNRACLAFVDTRHDARAQLAMETFLTYQWKLYYTIPGKPGALHLYGIYPCTTICLYFAKGHVKASPYIPDTFVSTDRPDNGFKWQKNEAILLRWLSSFSSVDDVVVDLFCGSGSIPAVCKAARRRYLGFEIDAARAEGARQRVQNTQLLPPPLFVLQPEQTGMDL